MRAVKYLYTPDQLDDTLKAKAPERYCKCGALILDDKFLCHSCHQEAEKEWNELERNEAHYQETGQWL